MSGGIPIRGDIPIPGRGEAGSSGGESGTARPHCTILVMGVSGSGKTTIAAALAQHLGWPFLEGDDFHPPANVAKMRAGTPLTDEDRWPWLQAIADRLDTLKDQGQSAVVACSALKRAYRSVLLDGRADSILVFPRGSQPLIADRMRTRHGHFMPAALLDSQFATLEEPGPDEHPLVIDIDGSRDEVIARALDGVRRRLGPSLS
ncbi:gluconokinase [Rhodopila sp.]|uniref:gluconokinase n=1 Tax=Rhodopila sp. TaxID=2480087 RepID=UPI002C2B4471|nr:gluconokinase [Rhodopila sp.]HVZ10741.1 gluconokinase [Rhodopila sp.]